jgi:Tfp pilus assembly protein PilV
MYRENSKNKIDFKNMHGVSLVEVSIALLVFLIALLALAQSVTLAIGINRKNRENVIANTLCKDKIEQLLSLDFDDVATDTSQAPQPPTTMTAGGGTPITSMPTTNLAAAYASIDTNGDVLGGASSSTDKLPNDTNDTKPITSSASTPLRYLTATGTTQRGLSDGGSIAEETPLTGYSDFLDPTGARVAKEQAFYKRLWRVATNGNIKTIQVFVVGPKSFGLQARASMVAYKAKSN